MNTKHSRTLNAIFAQPVPSNIYWSEIEALLIACGCTLKEGSGSRVKFTLKQIVFATHRPHPQKEAKQYVVREVKEFLIKTGISP